LSDGRIIITSTIIPNPPIHCVRLLQKRIDFGSDSTSAKIVEPVVENPDADSKKASKKEVMDPLKIYGNMPKNVRANHDKVTAIIPSLLVVCWISVFLERR
jgi:hypothetical protein